MNFEIMAMGVHPDDVELGCAGVLKKHINKGQAVCIVDLTEGELGSRGTVETRYEEAKAASTILGVQHRHNLKMEDGFFEHNRENVLKIIEIIRHFRPKIVLANAPSDRHPDHGRASKLIRDAAFLSGLRKIESSFEGVRQEPWRPKRVFQYIQDKYLEPSFIVDISETFADKMKSVEAYGTQFSSKEDDGEPSTYISSPKFLENVSNRAAQFGKRIGVAYGEGFISEFSLGIEDFNALLFPEIA